MTKNSMELFTLNMAGLQALSKILQWQQQFRHVQLLYSIFCILFPTVENIFPNNTYCSTTLEF